MIPNHVVMISFWGETRGQPKLCNYYSQPVKISFFCKYVVVVTHKLRPPNNPKQVQKHKQDVSHKIFIKSGLQSLQHYKLISSTDRVVEENQ